MTATVIDLIRHVRTAEGARFYGLPIGAPITRDVVLRRMRMAKSRNNPLQPPNVAALDRDERDAYVTGKMDLDRSKAPQRSESFGKEATSRMSSDSGNLKVKRRAEALVTAEKEYESNPTPANRDKVKRARDAHDDALNEQLDRKTSPAPRSTASPERLQKIADMISKAEAEVKKEEKATPAKKYESPEDVVENKLRALRKARDELLKNPTDANKAKVAAARADYNKANADYKAAQKPKPVMNVVRPPKEPTPAEKKKAAAVAKQDKAKSDATALLDKVSKGSTGSKAKTAERSESLGAPATSRMKAGEASKRIDTKGQPRSKVPGPTKPGSVKPGRPGSTAASKVEKRQGPKKGKAAGDIPETDAEKQPRKKREAKPLTFDQVMTTEKAREAAIEKAIDREKRARDAYDRNPNGANRTELQRARQNKKALIAKRDKVRKDAGLEKDGKYDEAKNDGRQRGGPGSDKDKQEDRSKNIETKMNVRERREEEEREGQRRRRRRRRRDDDDDGGGTQIPPKDQPPFKGTPNPMPGTGKPGIGQPMPGKPGVGTPGTGVGTPNPNPMGVLGQPDKLSQLQLDARLKAVDRLLTQPKKAGLSASDKNAMDILSQERSALIAERDRRFAQGTAQAPGESTDASRLPSGPQASFRAGPGVAPGSVGTGANVNGAAMGARSANNYRGAVRVARNGTVRNVDNDKVYGKIIHKPDGIYAVDVQGDETGPYKTQGEAVNFLRRAIAAGGPTRPAGGSLAQRSSGLGQSTAARQVTASDAVDGLPLGARVEGKGPDGTVYAVLPDGTKAVFKPQANGGVVRTGGTWDTLPPGATSSPAAVPGVPSGVSANSVGDADLMLQKAGVPTNVAALVRTQADRIRAMMNAPGDTVPLQVPGKPGQDVQISKAMARQLLADGIPGKRERDPNAPPPMLGNTTFDLLDRAPISPADKELVARARTSPGQLTPADRARLADLLREQAARANKSGEGVTARRLSAGAAVMDRRKRPGPEELLPFNGPDGGGGDIQPPQLPQEEQPQAETPQEETETREQPDGNIQIWLGNRQIGLFIPGAQAGPGAGTLVLPGGKRQEVMNLGQATKNAWADSTAKAVKAALRGAGFKGVQTAVLSPQGEGFRVDVTADGRIQLVHVGDIGGNETVFLNQYKQALESQRYIVQYQTTPAALWVVGKAAAGVLRTKGTKR